MAQFRDCAAENSLCVSLALSFERCARHLLNGWLSIGVGCGLELSHYGKRKEGTFLKFLFCFLNVASCLFVTDSKVIILESKQLRNQLTNKQILKLRSLEGLSTKACCMIFVLCSHFGNLQSYSLLGLFLNDKLSHRAYTRLSKC